MWHTHIKGATRTKGTEDLKDTLKTLSTALVHRPGHFTQSEDLKTVYQKHTTVDSKLRVSCLGEIPNNL
jgi:hypothetical protein